MAVQTTADDPAQQVDDAISLMRQYVVEDSTSPEIIADVQAAIAAYPYGYPCPIVDACWRWVKNHIRFQHDQTISSPIDELKNNPVIEVLIRPVDMSNIIRGGGQAVGDCDDFSMYLAAMLLCAGVDVAFATVAADPAAPTDYSHVYVVAYAGAGNGHSMRIPVDASHGKFAGWEVENRFGRRKEWPIGGKFVWA